MKGVLFTTDAIFSLIIVAFAITILAYFEFTPTTTALISSSTVQAILSLFTQTQLQTMLLQSSLGGKLFYSSSGSVWQQFGSDPSHNNAGSTGPQYPLLLYSYYVPNGITSPLVGGYGNIYLGSDDQILALNATSGTLNWAKTPFSTTNTLLYPSGFAVYSGMLLYSNGTQLHSIYPNNGTSYWSYDLPANYIFTTQPLVYNGKIILGAYSGSVSQIYAITASNGALSWNTITTFPVNGLSIINGSIMASSLTGNLILLGYNGTTIWTTPSTAPDTNISVAEGTAFLGNGDKVCGLNIDGTNSFCENVASKVSSVSGYSNNSVVYENATSVGYIAYPTALWSYSNSTFGVPYGYSILSNNLVYSLWSNGFVSAVNISTGALSWETNLPSTTLGSDILSGGVLSVVDGNYIYSFGSCFSNISSTVAYTVSYLYSKHMGGCATYLSYSLDPSYNYSIQLNGNFAYSNTLYSFNGVSYVEMNYPSNSGISLYMGTGGTGTSLGSAFTSNSWYLVGVVNNVTSNKLVTYVNNNAISIAAASGTQSYSMFQWIYPYNVNTLEYIDGVSINSGSTNTLSIGCGSISSCSNGFNGIITNLQIYSQPITTGDILSLYNGGISSGPISSSGILAWLPLNGDSNDYGGFGNTGYPFNIVPISISYISPIAYHSQQISQVSVTLPIPQNQFLTGAPQSKTAQAKLYSFGVYTWK